MFQETTKPQIEFVIDDSLDDISRLEKYHKTHFNLQRFVLARDLLQIAENCGPKDCVQRLLPIFPVFIEDKEVIVRQAAGKSLVKIYTFLQKHMISNNEKKQLNEKIKSLFIPVSMKLSLDETPEINEEAVKSNIVFIQKLKKEEDKIHLFLNPILKVVADCEKNEKVHDDDGSETLEVEMTKEKIEHLRKCVIRNVTSISEYFNNPELIEKKVLPMFLKLSSTTNIQVKKTCAEYIGKLSKGLKEEKFEKLLLPVYINFCKDEIWLIRKMCLKSLFDVSGVVSEKTRNQKLVGLFEMLKKDVSRWVKLECFKQLGPFISTFPETQVNDKLINYFTNMVFQESSYDGLGMGYNAMNSSIANELNEFAAYNFPAVAQNIGKKRWFQLERAYNQLTKNSQWKIRKCIASSLQVMVKIVGPKIADNNFLGIFEFFLSDLDEIKYKIVKNLVPFLKELNVNSRIKAFHIFNKLPDETSNWRIRLLFVEQSVEIFNLLESTSESKNKDIRLKFLNTLLILYDDPFSTIRKEISKISGDLYSFFLEKGDKKCEEKLYDTIIKLSKEKWNRRQQYVYACRSLVDKIPKNLFVESFLHTLIKIGKAEKVSIVRTTLIELFNYILSLKNFKKDKDIISIRDFVEQTEDRSIIDDDDEDEKKEKL